MSDPRGFYWKRGSRGITIWWPWRREPRIYLPRAKKDDADWINRTLWHERVHVRQWKQWGRTGFLWRYLRRRERLEIEAEAVALGDLQWVLAKNQPYYQWLDYYAKLMVMHHPPYTAKQCQRAIESYLPKDEQAA